MSKKLWPILKFIIVAIIGAAIVEFCHLFGWYPDRRLAEIVMQSPSLVTERAFWVLFVILIGLILLFAEHWIGYFIHGRSARYFLRRTRLNPYLVIAAISGIVCIGFVIGYWFDQNKSSPISREFHKFSEDAGGLGASRGSLEQSTIVYHAVHEHGYVVWLRELNMHFLLPLDQSNRKAVRQIDADWDLGREWYEEDRLRTKFNPPQGKLPPKGGFARHWDRDPQRISWIGWRLWDCVYRGEKQFFYQKFEHGIIMGPLHLTKQSNDDAQYFLIRDDGTWAHWSASKSVKAPPCED